MTKVGAFQFIKINDQHGPSHPHRLHQQQPQQHQGLVVILHSTFNTPSLAACTTTSFKLIKVHGETISEMDLRTFTHTNQVHVSKVFTQLATDWIHVVLNVVTHNQRDQFDRKKIV